jgi:hypothetical protein
MTRRVIHTSDGKPSSSPPSPAERRALHDRRSRPTPLLTRYFLWGRRRGARRQHEQLGLYVDRLAPTVAWLILIIWAFQCLDAILTLAHLLRGGKELNPLMAFVIDSAPGVFLAIKLGFSLMGLMFLGIHQNFPYVRKGLGALFVAFLVLMIYHLVILGRALLLA